MPVSHRELAAVLQSSWDGGAGAVEEMLERAGWHEDERSTGARVFASNGQAGDQLRMIEVRAGQIVRVIIPERLKGTPEQQLAEMQALIKEVSSLMGCEPVESDISDDWTWEGTERTATYGVRDDNATVEILGSDRPSDPRPVRAMPPVGWQ